MIRMLNKSTEEQGVINGLMAEWMPSWLCKVTALLLLSVSVSVSAAPAVTANVPLNFGLLAVKTNGVVSTLTISSAGAVSNTGEIIPMGGAVRGQYRLSGFPPGVLLELQWDNATLSAGGGGLPEHLQVTNYVNPTLAADAFGEAVVPVGATLKTSASGMMYVDAPYSGTTQVRVRYWSEPDGGYLIHYGVVTLVAQLQSVFSVTEAQPLSFGLIAAFSNPGVVASMTLGVNSALRVANSGGARILPLGGAQIGLIRVTGAAPNNVVTITPQATDIFLTHVTEGLSAARFVVKSFVTSPSSPGARTDAMGELQIKVGATLETELTNKAYLNGAYSGTYSLTVTY